MRRRAGPASRGMVTKGRDTPLVNGTPGRTEISTVSYLNKRLSGPFVGRHKPGEGLKGPRVNTRYMSSLDVTPSMRIMQIRLLAGTTEDIVC
ncbi:unnamed protein product [Nezara viridula]|uniref:Uncharacterized protein n=1 Tax=Nezara viridula TaxID=85310 RepID=A0A9P0EDK9_NEZVI|nr:unnamed protein product [Nezara viridula]